MFHCPCDILHNFIMRSFNLQLVGKFICKEKKHIFNDSSGMGDGDTEAKREGWREMGLLSVY